jgi:two-component system, chemotaxis family, chemotaxis protein CheY
MPGSPRVIIADDHDAVRGLLARLVVRQYPSVTIVAVANGAEALDSYRQHGADLVITNQDMPVLDGLDLIRALRSSPPRVPILMVSSNPAIEAQALTAGADRFLLKPFSVDALRRVLIDLLPP